MSVELIIDIFVGCCAVVVTLPILFLISLMDKENNKDKKVKPFAKQYLDFLYSSSWKEMEKNLDHSNYIDGRYKELYVYGEVECDNENF